jgi:hypothetical protein
MPPLFDAEVVIPAFVLHTPKLDDLEAASLCTVVGHPLLEPEDAVRNTLNLQIATMCRSVVNQDHRRTAADKELLEG